MRICRGGRSWCVCEAWGILTLMDGLVDWYDLVCWFGFFCVLGSLGLVLTVVGLTAVCGVCSADMDSGLLLLC
jgi:hypothetical protein